MRVKKNAYPDRNFEASSEKIALQDKQPHMEESSSEVDHIRNADRKKIFVRSWTPIHDPV